MIAAAAHKPNLIPIIRPHCGLPCGLANSPLDSTAPALVARRVLSIENQAGGASADQRRAADPQALGRMRMRFFQNHFGAWARKREHQPDQENLHADLIGQPGRTLAA